MNLNGRDPKDAALFDAIATMIGGRRRLLKGANSDDVAHDLIVNMRQYLAPLPADMVAELNGDGEVEPWLPQKHKIVEGLKEAVAHAQALNFQQLVDSRIHWKGLAERALSLLRVLEAQQPGITGRRGCTLEALSEMQNELVLREGA